MDSNDYIIRRANSMADGKKLNDLFTEVFYPEEVGILAETFFHSLPGKDNQYWFIAEEKSGQKIVSAFTLIPWVWQFEGIDFKVAELGIVGTLEEHRGKGLMKILNREFLTTYNSDGFDLSVIQGIPGFYNQFGYYYSIPLENHITVPFDIIDSDISDRYSFRLATMNDISYLKKEDELYRKKFSITSIRNNENWNFIFTDSQQTEYSSDYWIVEKRDTDEKIYFKISLFGFGEGLIVSEISESVSYDTMKNILSFLKIEAEKKGKPHIRFNLSDDSEAGKIAYSMGAEKGVEHAWQIKISDKINFFKKISPILEKRISESLFSGLSDNVVIDFYKYKIILIWKNGKIVSVEDGNVESEYTFLVAEDLFPALILGYRSWMELRFCRADIMPASPEIGEFFNTLFPKKSSWIYSQY